MAREELTVGELRKALEEVPDDLKVKLSSDSGVDQGEGRIIIESARRVKYSAHGFDYDYFDIYANDIDVDDEDEYEED